MSRITDEKLLRMLDADPIKLEKHFEHHPEDADRVEALTELSAPIFDRLSGALGAPTDLAARVQARLAGDPLSKETMQLTTDLLGLAWRTARAVFGNDAASATIDLHRAGEN